MANKLSTLDIAWIAGLLEGEGCFTNSSQSPHRPKIQLCMTDSDVVVRAAKLLKCHKVTEQKNLTKKNKKIYRATLYGRRAASWMMTLYPLMGERRQKRIEELLTLWKEAKKNYPERTSYSRGATIVWSREDG